MLLGDSSTYVSPCFPLPLTVTPHDGNTANDGGWTLVDFCTAGATGNGPATAGAPSFCHHNDDDSAGSQPLPFTFTLFTDNYTSLFINNNGNLSFGALFSTFTSTGFPVNGFPMVAPFWSDIDTRPTEANGHVWFQFFGGNTMAVTWDNVGYFNQHSDKLNTFQVVISDGTNPAMGQNNNVCFCYDDMQWTTGDASDGIGGFGGTPATVGANRGNNTDFFQIGRFDHAGTDYDGSGGNNDGVDFLDNKGVAAGGSAICFNAAGTNTPPIPVGFPANDEVSVECSETLDLTVQFLSPEGQQTTSVTVSDPDGAQAAGLVITNNPGNTATLNFNWTPDSGDAGTYVLTLTATDSFQPPRSTVKTLTINVDCPAVPATSAWAALLLALMLLTLGTFVFVRRGRRAREL